MFYPVDPEVAASWTTEAVYPLDPVNWYWPITHASDWERFGNDPAFEGPPASSAKPFPLVVFSPGWTGPIWQHNWLAGRLASHGIVVAVMYHLGDGFYGEGQDHIAYACLNRPPDVSFVLDDVLVRNATPGALLEGVVDPELIAASGFSLGGYAAMVLAAGIDNVGDFFAGPEETQVSLDPDPRIKAIVSLDGSNQVLTFEELKRVTVPSIGIGEEWTRIEILNLMDASWQARQHAAFQGHPNYRVDVDATTHRSFCRRMPGLLLAHEKGFLTADQIIYLKSLFDSAPLENLESNRLAAKYAIAFLQTVLAGKPGYQPILTPGHALKREEVIEFFVTEKRSPSSIDEDWPDYFVYFMHQPGSEQAKAAKNPKLLNPMDYLGL